MLDYGRHFLHSSSCFGPPGPNFSASSAPFSRQEVGRASVDRSFDARRSHGGRCRLEFAQWSLAPQPRALQRPCRASEKLRLTSRLAGIAAKPGMDEPRVAGVPRLATWVERFPGISQLDVVPALDVA